MLLSSGKIANNPNMGHSNGERKVPCKGPVEKTAATWRPQVLALGDVRKAVRPRTVKQAAGCTLRVCAPNILL